MGIRVKSTRSAIEAIVAIYRSFESPKSVIHAPLRTHHVPMSPALNPESAHPIRPRKGVGVT